MVRPRAIRLDRRNQVALREKTGSGHGESSRYKPLGVRGLGNLTECQFLKMQCMKNKECKTEMGIRQVESGFSSTPLGMVELYGSSAVADTVLLFDKYAD